MFKLEGTFKSIFFCSSLFLTLQKENGDIATWYLKFYLLKPDLLVVFPTLPNAQAKSLRVILRPLFPPSLQPIH